MLLFPPVLVGPSYPLLSLTAASHMELSWPALKILEFMNPRLLLRWAIDLRGRMVR